MIRRIDVFMPPMSQYNVLHYMTKDIYDALQRLGVSCRLLIAERENPQPFLESIFSDPPDCTLSLNGLLPDEKGNFFCDMIKIPHIACLVDSPNLYVSLTQSPLNIITCPDVFACHFFQGMNFENVLFLPHGVSKDITPDPTLEKSHDVIFLGTCIDYESIRGEWKEKYSSGVRKAMEIATEITLSDDSTPYAEAFVQAVNEVAATPDAFNPAELNLLLILNDLEMYLRGKDRVKLIQSIKDAKVEVFGSGNWSQFLDKNNSNVTIHSPVPYEEALTIMQKSKIFLNSCPWIKCGGHERLFAGIACGALAVTDQNVFMSRYFEDGKDIAFYQHGKLEKVNEMINEYLSDDNKRESVIRRGRESVMKEHTWDSRLKLLLEQVPPLLEKARASLR